MMKGFDFGNTDCFAIDSVVGVLIIFMLKARRNQ